MKKYNLLVATCLAIGFGLGFLFYKHEYDKLYNVLQVLDTFGDPDPSHQCALGDYDYFAPDYWHTLQNVNISLFSAYWEQTYNHVIVFGVGNTTSNLSCWLWYDFESVPIQGLLKILPIEQSNAIVLLCSNKRQMGAPYGIVISEWQPSKKINLHYVHSPKTWPEYAASACVEPLNGPFIDRLLLAQFLQYHYSIGINQITFYDSGISPQVREQITKKSRDIGINSVIVAWDSSIGNDEIFLRDCIYRNMGSHVFLTSPKSFLILDHHSNVSELFSEIGSYSAYQLQNLHFCTNKEDDPATKAWKPKLQVLQKTEWITKDLSKYMGLLIKSDSIKHFKSIKPKEQLPFAKARIHSYDQCSKEDLKSPSLRDRSLHKFSNLLLTSPLLKYL